MDTLNLEQYQEIALPENLQERARVLLENHGKEVVAKDRMVAYHKRDGHVKGTLVYDGSDSFSYALRYFLKGIVGRVTRWYGIHNLEMLLVKKDSE